MDSLARSELILRASLDPVFFVKHPYFLGIDTLYPMQEAILRRFYKEKFMELVLIAGMRSGKTFLSSLFATYELFQLMIMPEPAHYFGLARGSKIFINCVAPSEDQGMDTVFAELQGRITYSPFFKEFDPKIHQADIIFPKDIMMRVLPSTSASQAGRTAKAVIMDEIDRFEEAASRRGAWTVYNTISRSVQTLGKAGHKIEITSPLHQNSIGMVLFRKNLPSMLCLKIPTWEFNPHISRESLNDEFEKDPMAAMRDYGCEPFESLSPFYSNPDVINIIDKPNILEMMYEKIGSIGDKSQSYILACDPAVKHDGFGLTLAHQEKGQMIIDGVFAFRPHGSLEISPREVRDYFSRLCDAFSLRYAIWDYPMYPDLMEYLRSRGVDVVQHVAKKEDHDRVKEMFYSKTLSIPRHQKLIEELTTLQVIDAKKVDHPRGGSKDIADTLANAVWLMNDKSMTKPVSFNLVQILGRSSDQIP